MRRLWAVGFALVVTVALVACDSGPSGPGTLDATLDPPPQTSVGAALLTISGDGVRGISVAGDTRVFSAATDTEGTYRVILVGLDSTQELRFRVEVSDLGAAPPIAAILELVDPNNEPLASVSGAHVHFH